MTYAVLVTLLCGLQDATSPWPLAKGSKWVYKTDQEVDMIYEIVGLEKVGDVECHVLEVRTSEDRVMRSEWLTVAKDGVKVHQGRRGRHATLTVEKPYFRIKSAIEKGATWEGESRTGDAKVTTFNAEAVEEVEVEVPAGKYKAWKIKTSQQTDSGGTTAVEWWAPDVGMVRAEIEFNFSGTGMTAVYELKEFTKGK